MRGVTRRFVALLVVSGPVLGHESIVPSDAISLPWSFEPWLVACICFAAVLYARGIQVLWGRAGAGRGVGVAEVLSFAGGLAVLSFALMSPLDALAERLFCAHMTEHELLMLVAAPLLVMGRPLAVWTWALPAQWRRTAVSPSHWQPLAMAWMFLTAPVVAWALHAVILWGWHLPRLFDAALQDPSLHVVQHASFLGSALLFWWSLLRHRRSGLSDGAAVIYIFTTMIHTGALGALLSISRVAWYPPYLDTAPAWGMSALEDQQIGGLIMWMPASAVYAVAGLFLVHRWMRAGPPFVARVIADRVPRPDVATQP